MKKLFVFGLPLLVLLGTPSRALGGDTLCVGFVTGAHDNVVVPPNGVCTIGNAMVRGNVKALENAWLFTFNTTVGGSIDGDKAEVMQVLAGTVVGGNVTIKEGEVDDNIFDVAICGTTVNGNVEVVKMTGEVLMGGVPGLCPNTFRGNLKIEGNFLLNNGLDININSIRQTVQVFKNSGPAPKQVIGNVVGDTITCKENAPPFVGGPNVAPKKEGQCF